jgi:hypothetical protein
VLCGKTAETTEECAECRERRLSNRRNGGNFEPETRNNSSLPPIVREVLRSPGQPLDTPTHALMKRRFGHGFSQVRVAYRHPGCGVGTGRQRPCLHCGQ